MKKRDVDDEYYWELTLAAERAYLLFRALGWEWAGGKAPTSAMLRDAFKRLAQGMGKNVTRAESGRLAVGQDEDGVFSFYVCV